MSQPPPIEYARPMPREPKPPIAHLWWKFFAGLGAGCAVSLLFWLSVDWNSQDWAPVILAMMLILPVLKLATGIPFTCIRRWRPMGIGILVSIALGSMIMFFGCVARMNMNFH